MEAITELPRTALKSFEDFYAAEFARVYRAVHLSLGDREMALDVTQEAFKRAYARWRRLSEHEWAGGWVMTTALNLCRRSWARRLRERRRPAGDVEEARGPNPNRVDVAAGLRRLPERQRQALVLNYIGDLPLPAVADLMGVSEGAVKAHLAQGRATLRKLLEVGDE